jgi:hypothetical protein
MNNRVYDTCLGEPLVLYYVDELIEYTCIQYITMMFILESEMHIAWYILYSKTTCNVCTHM